MYLRQILYYKEHDKIVDDWDPKKNALIVSPTGSGKTIILLRMIDKFLKEKPYAKVLVLCPTNILTDQIQASFKKFSTYDVVRVTRNVSAETQMGTINLCTGHRAAINYRENIWSKQFFPLIAFDEVHKMGPAKSPYTTIHELTKSDTIVKVGCTATLVKKLRKKLLKCFELEDFTTGESPVSWSKHVVYEKVNFSSRRNFLFAKSRDSILKKYSHIFNTVNKTNLEPFLEEPLKLFTLFKYDKLRYSQLKKQGATSLNYMSHVKNSLHVMQKLTRKIFLRYFYFYECYETYEAYSAKDPQIRKLFINPQAFWNYLSLFTPYENEKFNRIKELLKNEKSTTIVFMDNYTTLKALKNYLEKDGFNNVLILGGKAKLSTKERNKTLAEVKNSANSVILTTSVAEEGLDIGSANLVIFYRPVLNQVNYTQRKGRTGRHAHGTIAIMYYDKTVEKELVDRIKNTHEKIQAESCNLIE